LIADPGASILASSTGGSPTSCGVVLGAEATSGAASVPAAWETARLLSATSRGAGARCATVPSCDGVCFVSEVLGLEASEGAIPATSLPADSASANTTDATSGAAADVDAG